MFVFLNVPLKDLNFSAFIFFIHQSATNRTSKVVFKRILKRKSFTKIGANVKNIVLFIFQALPKLF